VFETQHANMVSIICKRFYWSLSDTPKRFQGGSDIDKTLHAQIRLEVKEALGEYSNSVWYRTMKWSSAGIVIGVLIIIAASASPENTPYKKLGVWAHTLLMTASAIGLVVSISYISTKAARQYVGRQQHQIWGLISITAILFNVLLGFLWLYTKYKVGILHRINGTFAYILVLATSSIALIHFMDWSASAVISIAVFLAIIVIYAVAIKIKYGDVQQNTFDSTEMTPVERKEDYTNTNGLLRRSSRYTTKLYM